MTIPIEDNFEDILGKAQRGLGLSDTSLSVSTGVPEVTINSLKEGVFDEAAVRKVCAGLNLHPDRLIAVANKSWQPKPVDVPCLSLFNTTFGDMTVNAYLVWDPPTKQAAVFDTGANADAIISTVKENGLEVGSVFLTHTHPDHIADLPKLLDATGNPSLYANRLEPHSGAELFEEGSNFKIGSLDVSTYTTSGHSVGGTTFVISGLEKLVAIVGDAIFAGSMGGGAISFTDALANNSKKILTLPDDTVLCPGHGPMTTAGEEKIHNPFYP